MNRRVSSIHQINNKYRGSRVSPSRVIVTGGGASAISPIGGATAIRRSRIRTSGVGAPVFISGTSGVVGAPFRSSQVRTVNHPPVYEVVTTPPRVYEIVTPIIEVTPDTVIQQTTTATGGNVNTRLWAKRDQSSCCPWWCWLLFGLLLLALLAGGLLYFFREKIFGPSKSVVDETSNKTVRTEVTETKATQSNTQDKVPDPIPVPPVPVEQPHQPQGTESESKNVATTQEKKEQPKPVVEQKPKEPVCDQGSFLYKGKCLRCPPQSTWNGSQCIKQVVTKRNFVEYKTEGEDSGDKADNEESTSKAEKSSTSTTTTTSTSSETSDNQKS